MSFEFISISTRERARHVFLSRAITVIKSRSCITTFLAVEVLFHFDRSMQLHSSLRKVFLPRVFCPVFLVDSLRSLSTRREGKKPSPLFAREKFNSFPTRSFVEYSPRFPRDSFSFLPSLRFSFILFSSIDQASNCCWCETRKFLDDRLTARVIFRFFIPYDFEFLFFFFVNFISRKKKKKIEQSNRTCEILETIFFGDEKISPRIFFYSSTRERFSAFEEKKRKASGLFLNHEFQIYTRYKYPHRKNTYISMEEVHD